MPALSVGTVHERIETDPKMMFGKPAIRGTRVTVERILRELGQGASLEEVGAAHPRVTADDVRAAQAFAADFLAGEDTSTAV